MSRQLIFCHAMIKCDYCGRRNPDELNHCAGCGTELNTNSTGSDIRKSNIPLVILEYMKKHIIPLLWIFSVMELFLIISASSMSLFIGSIRDTFLGGGFHIGPPPKPLYSPIWEWIFILSNAVLCVYYIIMLQLDWNRVLFFIGIILHFIFVVSLLLFLSFSLSWDRVFTPLTLFCPVLWMFYAKETINKAKA